MDGTAIVSDDQFDPPPRLYDRLRQVAGYTWDESRSPFHSTYDIWYVAPGIWQRFLAAWSPLTLSIGM